MFLKDYPCLVHFISEVNISAKFGFTNRPRSSEIVLHFLFYSGMYTLQWLPGLALNTVCHISSSFVTHFHLFSPLSSCETRWHLLAPFDILATFRNLVAYILYYETNIKTYAMHATVTIVILSWTCLVCYVC
jgi:hypothetical protein